ncbi:MAG: hypothetical protein ACFFAS_02250 [Promethearchaeota archaeon]
MLGTSIAPEMNSPREKATPVNKTKARSNRMMIGLILDEKRY